MKGDLGLLCLSWWYLSEMIILVWIPMKKAKEDDVSSLTKVIVDKIHGGRKQDSKYWEREVGNSRNDFVGYNNGEIPITQPIVCLHH